MRSKMKLFVLAAISVLLVFSGCKKDDDSEDNASTIFTATLSCNIDGVSYSVTPMGLMDEDELTFGGDNSVGILDFTLEKNITAGTYTIESGSANSFSWMPKATYYTYWPRPGTLIVTSHDMVNHKIEGTFSGTMKSINPPDVAITNGVFKVSYTYLP